MSHGTIDRLIINSPYTEPEQHWRYNRTTRSFELVPGRRPAGYIVASESARSFDDPGTFIEIPLVNQIRERVKTWRDQGYPGITGITRRLLDHWKNPDERTDTAFFFCQVEAIETLIWIVEAPASAKTGIEIPSGGGDFIRNCCKMATGSGKTVVMAMLIAWQVLNKTTYPNDPRFSQNVLVIAPGLTVKNRLSVLAPSGEGNYYDAFNIIPPGLSEKLRLGKVLVQNWHVLSWDSEEQIAKRRSVDKRGPKSDEAYVREVIGEMSRHKNLLVINDEAHHAWRVPAESKIKGVAKEDIDEATIWVQGLDRIHRARNILACFDFTATPFAPSGKKSSEEALFPWVVSDFSLNDAIESGLVKTPRVVIRDDGKLSADYKSRFYHIYMDEEVHDNLNRKAEESEPLPDLVNYAYYFLGLDWQEKKKEWTAAGRETPPVMITVANRTETAARIAYSFTHKKIRIDDLCDEKRILHIDSKVLKEAETQTEPLAAPIDSEDEETERTLTKKEQAELLRLQVDTVAKAGQPGAQIQNVISVGMLSEGWDARTVTHIMGLRAFSSQLLCEQVVGRGLRRTNYDVDPETGLFSPEYVNIFGVPFTFLPHEGGGDAPPQPEKPKTKIEALPSRQEYAITWPNVLRIEHSYRPKLSLDLTKAKPLVLEAASTPKIAELAPIMDGKPAVDQVTTIDLQKLGQQFRLQRIIFETARDVLDQMRPDWKGTASDLVGQLIRIVEQFIRSDKIKFNPGLFGADELRRRIMLILNMNRVVQHIYEQIREENAEKVEPVLDQGRPIRSTADMRPWYTSKPCGHTQKSQINFCVFDSTWEATEAFALDNNPSVQGWAKNDHLGFEILYLFKGVVRKYRPDYLIRLVNGDYLVLEVKGQDSQENQTKRTFLAEWIRAINSHGGFGTWHADVSFNPADIDGIIGKYVNETATGR